MFGMQMGRMGQTGSPSWLRTLYSLFASGEQGAWYDPSDLPTLFQDTAGTTPVTAVEQAVALMLDKSGRGNHASQATSTKRPKYSRRVNLLLSTESFGAGWSQFGSPSYTPNAGLAPDGSMTATGVTGLSGSVFRYFPVSITGTYTLSVWARGAAGGEDLILQSAPSGANSYFVLTTTWARYSFTFSGSWSRADITLLFPTQSAFFWGADLRLATDAHLPYQWVNTATDYDADPAKFPAYLRFDGVDDALQTGNIDFTGTDKMTVWAGVTKLSDAATGALLELSADSSTTAGTLMLRATDYPGGPEYTVYARGASAYVGIAAGIAAAPSTRLLTEKVDFAAATGQQVLARLNGVNGGAAATDTGGGSFIAAPLYIGARAGTSFYFNGRLYSLIVRGAQSSLSQIEATEAYIKQKMRLP